MADLTYSPTDILQQEFKTKMRGYDPVEVDEFLDGIIKDYEAYNQEILALQEENDRLHAKIAQLSKTQEIKATRTQPEAPKSQTVTNFDILKRLSNLEKEVFGKKLDQEIPVVATTKVVNENYTQATNDEDDLEKTRQF
ncbi:cell division regulator GpsB [Enterococcus saccharolyticus]|uniref:Cell cycle protein GpsB n=1 Tax=Enterococcus saccharolyticus subsp. saccharolyticus ATCC 43076 TaxID=1139996 RepID=S0JQX5_9ENTE|nr:cell division regulator GpsB [Enterococcus saccharolyticus]EOT29306.1 cell division protein DivIVA [Enterococcus saccharolyticus subsp. saccharolyticus ATCC 43076]EOT81104.1 cell division protein DivIVA [Enterococcus saccharolyticus subsp. saccharolyticus ATCC 43076]OJG86767.1 cell division protein DivIVA [Enterococcus saccharolyticus]